MKKVVQKLNSLFSRAAAEEYGGFEEASEETDELSGLGESGTAGIVHAEPGSFQIIKGMPKGHGEQMVLPDDCSFGDNDLCYVDA